MELNVSGKRYAKNIVLTVLFSVIKVHKKLAVPKQQGGCVTMADEGDEINMDNSAIDESDDDAYDTSDEEVSSDDESLCVSSDNSSVSSDTSDDSDGDSSGPRGGPPVASGVWMPVVDSDVGPPLMPFTGATGLKHPPDSGAVPLEYFKLFFTDVIINKIVQETNLYAEQWIEGHGDYLREKSRSVVHVWIKQGKTSVKEFYAFLGVILNTGLIRKPTIRSYWDRSNPSQDTPWFKEHFNRECFELLIRFLHFNDNSSVPQQDDSSYRLYKIQPIIDYFQKRFKSQYYPQRKLSINESIFGYRGKTPLLRQHMPNKHHVRFGIKVWCLCEAQTGYTVIFEVFRGTSDRQVSEGGATHDLVMQLLTQVDLLHWGHHLGLDNYFTSPKLFLDLWQKQTTATGTVHINRKGLPWQAVREKLVNHQVSERRKGPMICVAYRDGKKLLYYSQQYQKEATLLFTEETNQTRGYHV